MTEVLVAKTPSIIVARQQIDSVEQTMRASLFENLGICAYVMWNEHLERHLEEQIALVVEKTFEPKVHLDKCGKDLVAKYICQDMENKAVYSPQGFQKYGASIIPPAVVFHMVRQI